MNAMVLFRTAGRRGGAAAGACLLALASCGGGSDSSQPRTEVIRIQNTGSDTMVNLAQEWAEAYKKVDPSVSVEVAGGGSSVGITQLQEGFVDLANASREMTAAEKAEMKHKTGKEPIEWIVAYDGLAVYVHKDNPVDTLSLDELASMYGENGAATKWSDLGIDHKTLCPSDQIIRVSRQSSSGTYEFFREHVLETGDFKLGSRDMNGSKEVVELVANTKTAIGYSGMGYATPAVKMLKLSVAPGQPAVEPTIANTMNKTYPLARALEEYTVGEPQGAVKDYIDWMLSEAGQKIVADNGYVPLDAGPHGN